MTFSADDWDDGIAGNDDAPNIYTTNDCQGSGSGSATINLITVSPVPATVFCPNNLLLNGSFESPSSNTQGLDIWLDTVEATNSAWLTPKPDGLFYSVD